MSTNSTITLKRLDGTKTSIYCHWDGYIEHNGVILQRYYDSVEKIEELLKLGDLFSLSERINPTGEHSFEHPEEGVCVAFHRDRGDLLRFSEGEQQFNYVFDENQGAWFVTINACATVWSRTFADLKERCDLPYVKTGYLIDEIIDREEKISHFFYDEILDECKELAKVQIVDAQQRRAEEYNDLCRIWFD